MVIKRTNTKCFPIGWNGFAIITSSSESSLSGSLPASLSSRSLNEIITRRVSRNQSSSRGHRNGSNTSQIVNSSDSKGKSSLRAGLSNVLLKASISFGWATDWLKDRDTILIIKQHCQKLPPCMQISHSTSTNNLFSKLTNIHAPCQAIFILAEFQLTSQHLQLNCLVSTFEKISQNPNNKLFDPWSQKWQNQLWPIGFEIFRRIYQLNSISILLCFIYFFADINFDSLSRWISLMFKVSDDMGHCLMYGLRAYLSSLIFLILSILAFFSISSSSL